MSGSDPISTTVSAALSGLFARWERYRTELGGLPWLPYETEWRSPCQQGTERNGEIQWHPVRRQPPASMTNLETALECHLHPALSAFYCHWFSGSLPTSFKGLRVELVQPWNTDDFERLQENLIGHLLMQRRLKLPLTLFLASTRRDDWLISLVNDSGEVVLEQLGVGPKVVLAADLASFLARLSPLRA